ISYRLKTINADTFPFECICIEVYFILLPLKEGETLINSLYVLIQRLLHRIQSKGIAFCIQTNRAEPEFSNGELRPLHFTACSFHFTFFHTAIHTGEINDCIY